MIQYVKQGGDFGRAFIQQLKERSANSGKKVDDAVAEIVETVRPTGMPLCACIRSGSTEVFRNNW